MRAKTVQQMARRFFNAIVVWTMLTAMGVPVVMAAPMSREEASPVTTGALPGWWHAPEPVSYAVAARPVIAAVPRRADVRDGDTISGTQSSGVWGPGLISVSGDITIPAGATVVITPGTTVQVHFTDSLQSGLYPEYVEWIVSGTLQVNGPVTVTSDSIPKYPGDWYGIRIVEGGVLTMADAIVEYAVIGVELANNGPVRIENVTIRYMEDYLGLVGMTAGIAGGLHGDPFSTILISNTSVYAIQGYTGDSESMGGPKAGGLAGGIVLTSAAKAFTTTILASKIYSIAGGDGGDVDRGLVPGRTGGDGGAAYGINIRSSGNAPVLLSDNVISNVRSGMGGNVVVTASSNLGGGGGGVVYGIYIEGGGGNPVTLTLNTVYNISAGASGTSGWGSWGAGGPDACGIGLNALGTVEVHVNTVTTVTAGSGSDGLDAPAGQDGGVAGWGGYAYGMMDVSRAGTGLYTFNTIADISGGRGGDGGNGGSVTVTNQSGGYGAGGSTGGDAVGLHLSGLGASTTTVESLAITNIRGGDGGNGGDSGQSAEGGFIRPGGDGGAGGEAWGLFAYSAIFLRDGSIYGIYGGSGGDGGRGNDVAAEEPSGGGAGAGGRGGQGGRACGIELFADYSEVDPTYVGFVIGGDGGNGGAGGDDDETRLSALPATGNVVGGAGGVAGDGGLAYGYYNHTGKYVRFYQVTAEGIYGGYGGSGGAGGMAIGSNSGISVAQAVGGPGGNGGSGGNAYGFYNDGMTATVELFTGADINGGSGGSGGYGGQGYNETDLIVGGTGGNGGNAGAAYGLYNTGISKGSILYNNVVYSVTGYAGGTGGNGGTAIQTATLSVVTMTAGVGGAAGDGGGAWGLRNNVAHAFITRAVISAIRGGMALTGGVGGDIVYATAPNASVLGNGGKGGSGGDAYGADSLAHLTDILAYLIAGGDGGPGGDGGWEYAGLIPVAQGTGGAGGDGGSGVAYRARGDVVIAQSTGAKTNGGNGGTGGMGAFPGTDGTPAYGYGAWVTATWLMNDALISHTVGVFNEGGTTLLVNNFVSATILTAAVGSMQERNCIYNVAPGFENFGNDDYHLSGCMAPAAESGYNLAALIEDGDGEPRPWGYYDVGWDEYLPASFNATAFHGVITQNTVWSGTYLLDGDVVITPGAKLRVMPGTAVFANPVDGGNLGIDPNRVEIIVSGTLESGAPGGMTVTFSVTGCNPAAGQWYGIRFEPGSNGYLDPTVVEYAVHGVTISTTNLISIADSTIRYNYAESDRNVYGAGLSVYAGTTFITNTRIYSNRLRQISSTNQAVGAGIYVAGSTTTLLLYNVDVYNNHIESQGDGYGGGAAIWGGFDHTLDHVHFYENSISAGDSASGGGVDVDEAHVNIKGNTIERNIITATISGHGAGVAVIAIFSKVVTVTNSHILTNRIAINGSGSGYGGGLGFFAGDVQAVISGSRIAGNVVSATSGLACGGGLGLEGGVSVVEAYNNLIQDNTVRSQSKAAGGGLCTMVSDVMTAANNLIVGNAAETVVSNTYGGGGIYAAAKGARLFNNTIVTNTVNRGDGGGIYQANGYIVNTIVVSNAASGNGGGVRFVTGTLDYSTIWGNSPDDLFGMSFVGTENFSLDPMFVGSGSVENAYHLQHGSPCIDAGRSMALSFDYDGQGRPLGVSPDYDIGFDEVEPLFYIKSPDQGVAYLGETLVYTVAIANADPYAKAEVIVRDPLPSEVECKAIGASDGSLSVNYSGCYAGNEAWWSGVLPSHYTLFLFITTTVRTGLRDGHLFSNSAIITVGTRVSYATNTVSRVVHAPVLTLTKWVADPATPVIGGPLTYTLLITNSGQGGATNVVVTDAIPSDAYHFSGGTLVPEGWVSMTTSLIAAGGGSAQVSFAVTTCKRTITNTSYRVVTNVQGIASNWGVSVPATLIPPTIQADFIVNPQRVAAGRPVYFDDRSTTNGSPLVSWAWDLGDSSSGAGQHISHTYSAAGIYTVTMRTTDGCGYTATRSLTVEVLASAPYFTLTKAITGSVGSYGSLVAGTTLTYVITISNTGNQTGTNVVITDTIPGGANYIAGGTRVGDVVSWTVATFMTNTTFEAQWTLSTCQRSLRNEWYRVASSDQGVNSAWGPVLSTTLDFPFFVIHVYQSSSDVAAGETVTFTDATSTDGGPLVDRLWDFGDGHTAHGKIVTHTYTAAGSYSLTLTVRDGCGYTGTRFYMDAVRVHQPDLRISKRISGTLIAGLPLTYILAISNANVYAGATGVVVTDALPVGATYIGGGSESGGVVTWSNLDVPANSSVEASFSLSTCKTSLVNASYRVVTSAQGVDSPWGAPLTTALASPALYASFDVAPSSVYTSEAVYFTDTTTTNGGPIVSWAWNLGDGHIGVVRHFSHTYATPGTYTVMMQVSDGCGYTDTATATVTVRAIPTYTLKVHIVGSGTVTIHPQQSYYLEGTQVVLTATPESSWYFTGWSGDVNVANNPITITMDSNKEVTATFSATPPPTYTLQVNIVGQGSVTRTPDQTSYVSGTVVDLEAVPGSGWRFVSWSGDLSGSTNPVSITMDSDKVVTATFEQIPTYTLTVHVVGEGRVTLNPPGGVYEENAQVTLRAVPTSPWVFGGWSGDASGSGDTVVVTMDSDKVVTATFERYYTLTIAMAGNGSGTVSPTVGRHTYLSGTTVPVTAAPDAGSRFIGWSGDLSGNADSTTILMDGDKYVTATFELIPTYTLTVHVVGSGTVSVDPNQAYYLEGTAVTLTATPDGGAYFVKWSGAITVANNPVSLVMDGDKEVTATFSATPPPTYLLQVNIVGQGSVTKSPDRSYYTDGTQVELTAIPNADWFFVGWSGDVSGTVNPATVVMNGDKVVTATFSPIPTHTVTIHTVGSGSVTLDPAGGVYHENTVVTLTAVPNGGWQFAGWSGDLNNVTNPITILMNSDYVITATFERYYVLIITVAGNGSGTVSPTVGSHTYLSGTTVWVSAQPDADSRFVGWSGDAAGTASPVGVLMDGDKAITATFELIPTYTLAVHVVGSGTVTLNPTGGVYQEGTSVELTAVPSNGWYFVGWSGDLSYANNPATLIMDGDKEVTATFSATPPPTYLLQVNIVGQGSVTKNPDQSSYVSGTLVELGASPAGGWRFVGWSGDVISTADTISILMDSDKEVTATFEQVPTHTLSVHVVGSGTVTVTPDQAAYIEGAVVTLTATPSSGWQFAGWSGDLSGTVNPISITMDGNKIVTATFSRIPATYTLTVHVVGSGTVILDPTGGVYQEGTRVTLTAVPSSGWYFVGWSGDLTTIDNPISLVMDNRKEVTATFSTTPLPTYTLQVNVVGQGSVTKTPDQSNYVSGTVVQLTAVPSTGWRFDGWSGDLSGAANPISITVNGDKVVTATFRLSITCIPVSGLGFTSTPQEPRVGEPVTFTASVQAGTLPITYTWDFGDGSAARVGNPIVHTFPVTATTHTYTVTLTAANTCPSQVTAKRALTVRPRYLYLPLVVRNY